uniref:Uncharacterized protein n=1 Tax=Prevotella sp. GTC17262 TaxID=3236797 RepID=A0AB33JE77_9BACT
MIYIHYYFESSSTPKYMQSIAKMMESVKNSVFVEDDGFSFFVKKLQDRLKECTPKNSDAHIENSHGQVSVYLKAHADNSILRLGYQPVRSFLRYFKASGFENVRSITFKEEEDQQSLIDNERKGGAL